MPELPEVETVRRGLAPRITGLGIRSVTVRERRLRWPVPRDLAPAVRGACIHSVERRAKYLLLGTDAGTLIVHLGMSGRLTLAPVAAPASRHEHVVFGLDRGLSLRYQDPRRFGAVLLARGDPRAHRLLADLGPEPLGPDFDGAHLFRASRGRRAAVKTLLMDGRVVAGVGNIYASEALFEAGVRPQRPAGRVSAARYERLAEAVRTVLEGAIAARGTTLRDYVDGVGAPGGYGPRLRVYGREGEPCSRCAAGLRRAVLGQRASYYCPRCQR